MRERENDEPVKNHSNGTMNLKQAVAAGKDARRRREAAKRSAAQVAEDAARHELNKQARARAKDIDPDAIYKQIRDAVKNDDTQVYLKENSEIEAAAIRLVCPDVTVTRDWGTVYEHGEPTYDTWYGAWYIKVPRTEETDE